MDISKPAKTLDVLGKTCPYPVLETGTALRRINTGEVLEVFVDFESSVKTGLPKLCERYDCKFEHIEQKTPDGKVFWKFYIEKSEKM